MGICAYEAYIGTETLSALGCEDPEANTCSLCDSSTTFSATIIGYVLIAFGLLNIVFAPYMMCQVWRNIMATVQENPEVVKSDKSGQRFISKDTVQAAFKDVFLKDFFVLGFFFASLGHAYVAQTGNTASQTPECVGVDGMGSGGLSTGCMIGTASFGVTLFFTFTYYCCSCCSGSVVLSQDVAESMEMPTADTNASMVGNP
jgi:hypothetical protein